MALQFERIIFNFGSLICSWILTLLERKPINIEHIVACGESAKSRSQYTQAIFSLGQLILDYNVQYTS